LPPYKNELFEHQTKTIKGSTCKNLTFRVMDTPVSEKIPGELLSMVCNPMLGTKDDMDMIFNVVLKVKENIDELL